MMTGCRKASISEADAAGALRAKVTGALRSKRTVVLPQRLRPLLELIVTGAGGW